MVTLFSVGCVCVLNYQIFRIFPIVQGDFVDKEYSLVYSCFLNHNYVVVSSVPIEINTSFTFIVKGCKYSFPFTL